MTPVVLLAGRITTMMAWISNSPVAAITIVEIHVHQVTVAYTVQSGSVASRWILPNLINQYAYMYTVFLVSHVQLYCVYVHLANLMRCCK